MRPPTDRRDYDAIKPRIFQIGFNKCGTRSFYDFFEKNGIKSVHYKRGDLALGISANIDAGKPPLEGWDKWTAYTDMQWVKKSGVIEACGFYKEFAAYYPRSYFILNTRNKDRWINSRRNHGTGQNYGNRYRLGLGLSTMDETVEAWSAMWDMHHEEVPKFFAQTGQHFLIYNIEEDKPDSLVRFLAPDFKTEASQFGHEGKTSGATTILAAKTENLVERPRNPYVTSGSTSKPVPEPKPDQSSEPAPADEKLSRRLQPRNDIVAFDEAVRQAPFEPVTEKDSKDGWTDNLIITIVKDQAPFLLEWIAHHRAIGFSHFLIFSHACSDGTDEMLNQLESLGIITHVAVDVQEETTPPAALGHVMKHPTVFESDWIVYIEVDEFVNIRAGNGTFACLLEQLPQNVTNIAMTWRIFGSSGITHFEDQPTIAQFDKCAPAYLPKPHTAWGFKTATCNIGAYQSLSAHRPGNLLKEFAKEVIWVNGSGDDITKDRAKSGWRSDVKTVGYNLVQINRYPLRSLEDFLLVRKETAEGANKPGRDTWIGLDWNSCRDITIQRNLPRMQAELDRLKSDVALAKVHETSVALHRERIASLKNDPDISAITTEAKSGDLDDMSRVLCILGLDGKPE